MFSRTLFSGIHFVLHYYFNKPTANYNRLNDTIKSILKFYFLTKQVYPCRVNLCKNRAKSDTFMLFYVPIRATTD